MRVKRLAAAVLSFALVTACDRISVKKNVAVPDLDKTAAINSGAACAPAELPLTARDGTRVFGTYYAATKPKALILLFHQAGSSKGEYATIAPQLVKAGYAALAIDQRSGGGLFGKNETAAAFGPEMAGDASYIQALPDLQAALDWAGQRDVPVILWGSSYSSALIFKLAADNPGKVAALLAFSPGEYFADRTLIERAAAKIDVPVFVATAGTPDEIATARPVVDALPPARRTVFVPKRGVHGSSLLIAAKNPAGAATTWQAVRVFLARAAP